MKIGVDVSRRSWRATARGRRRCPTRGRSAWRGCPRARSSRWRRRAGSGRARRRRSGWRRSSWTRRSWPAYRRVAPRAEAPGRRAGAAPLPGACRDPEAGSSAICSACAKGSCPSARRAARLFCSGKGRGGHRRGDPAARPERLYSRLLEMDGVGPATAAALVWLLGSRRFATPDRAVAFAGLDVRVRESGREGTAKRGPGSQAPLPRRPVPVPLRALETRVRASPRQRHEPHRRDRGRGTKAPAHRVGPRPNPDRRYDQDSCSNLTNHSVFA